MSKYDPLYDPEFDPYAPPREKAEFPSSMTEEGIWNDHQLLVMEKTAILPDRCVKCNAAAEGYRLRKKLSWHPKGYYFIILLHLLIYVIVALIVRNTAKIEIGLCPFHRAQRRNTILACWGLFFLAIILITVAAVREQQQEVWTTVCLIGSMTAFLTSLIVGFVNSRLITPKKIDKHYVWIKKVCPAFRADLSQWPGASEGRW